MYIHYFVLLLTRQNTSLAKFSNMFSTTILAPEVCGRERHGTYMMSNTCIMTKKLAVPMTKWLATLSFKKASSSSPQIMGLSCTQTILFQYSLVQLYSNFFRSYMTCSIMAKKDMGIQPRFEPGSSEFRSDALTN